MTAQKQLDQMQSALAYNLPWSEERTKWVPRKDGSGTFPYKYQMVSFDKAGDEAVTMFHGLNLAPREAVLDTSGVYEYTVGDSALFKRKKYVPRQRTAEEKAQLQSDRQNFGYSNEGAKKGHEENVQMHEEDKQMHKEKMDAFNEWKNEIWPEQRKLIEDTNFLIADLAAAFREYTKK